MSDDLLTDELFDEIMAETKLDLHIQDTGVQVGRLVVYDAFTRAMPPTARTGGGFVSILNKGETPDRLVLASSPAAPVVQLHNMTMQDGVMVMREMQDGIEIGAGETVTLKPGGMHIMFVDAAEPFVEGGTVPLTLEFEVAGRVMIDLPVAPLGATEMPRADEAE